MNDASRPATELSLHGSRILVGASLGGAGAEAIRAAANGARIAIVSDTNVAPLHAIQLAVRLGVSRGDFFEIPAGEVNKNRIEWTRLTNAMLNGGFGRDSVIVAVGGGVVGDLAGFAAATYMRGIPVIQVPTSLLAMIDAAIGGKTGVDTPAGKNLVGAFHHPALVVADPAVLATLPPRELRSGLAEALKHAIITSRVELDWLLTTAPAMLRADGPAEAVAGELVERNIRIKAGVVARDEKESGVRKTLNFGHTIGHAVEAASDYTMLHGECIAIGMRVEAMIAAALGLGTASLADDVTTAIRALELPTHPAMPMTTDAVIAATRADKKARAGIVEYALACDVGRMATANSSFGTAVADDVVRAAIESAFAG